ncbi:pentatricopeptide repeat-containing protein [Canna indica]|uniref:Pentatricopeptide repeat-containing protein n=1 Tax=Canna indica TaxID=4628 RepID=A0AAQ3KJK9_9LILI|nr:pentatricopeptide repeat-containing protein [Canna indica]
MAMATNAVFPPSSSVRCPVLYRAAPSPRNPTSSSSASFVLSPLSSSSTKLRSSTRPVPEQQPLPNDSERQHRALLVDAFHHNNNLRALLQRVSSSKDASPLQLLEMDGDWTDDYLWTVVTFLTETGRGKEALQVFEFWKNIEMRRNNLSNYSRIIKLFCGGSLMSEAISAFEAMKKCDLVPSLGIYNAIIHGFAEQKDFDNSAATLAMMLEAGLLPTPDTYNGLIRAYGSCGLYDEMSKCLKKMQSSGCLPDEVTYNTLITEFARSGLLEKMEGAYRVLSSKHMKLQTSTLVAMLEAYADLEVLDRMERVYQRILKSEAFIKENLIRKIATVYIKNYRFSQLEELGNDISDKWGRTDLVWYIMLLSSACLISKKGIESIVHEMEVAKVTINITITNILAHFYLNMRDFRSLDIIFDQARVNHIKPDIMTFGIFFDACKIGYDGSRVLENWRRNGFLEEVVELRTDDLVLTAFGKGFFMKHCEKLYFSLHSKGEQKKLWRYSDIINLVFGKKATRK